MNSTALLGNVRLLNGNEVEYPGFVISEGRRKEEEGKEGKAQHQLSIRKSEPILPGISSNGLRPLGMIPSGKQLIVAFLTACKHGRFKGNLHDLSILIRVKCPP